MEHPTTTEYSTLGYVVRYYDYGLGHTAFEAYNDLDWHIGTFRRERTAWAAIRRSHHLDNM